MAWSLTSLSTHEKCGFRYKLRYVEKIPEKRSEKAARGVDNHAIVEGFLKGTIQTLPEELSFYHSFFTGLRAHEIYPEAKVSLDKDWNPTLWDSPKTWFRGVLDLKLFERVPEGAEGTVTSVQTKEAVVYDWKTGKIYPDHDDQKSIYSLAVLSEHPSVQRVRAVHVYLDSRQNRAKTFDRGEMHQLRQQWENRVQKMEQDTQHIPNPGFHCRWCSYRRDNGGPCQF